jgi:hypothetical protein
MSTYKFYFGRRDKKLHRKIEALHADVLRVTRQRDALREVAEIAVNTEEAVENELRAMQQQTHQHND